SCYGPYDVNQTSSYPKLHSPKRRLGSQVSSPASPTTSSQSLGMLTTGHSASSSIPQQVSPTSTPAVAFTVGCPWSKRSPSPGDCSSTTGRTTNNLGHLGRKSSAAGSICKVSSATVNGLQVFPSLIFQMICGLL